MTCLFSEAHVEVNTCMFVRGDVVMNIGDVPTVMVYTCSSTKNGISKIRTLLRPKLYQE